MSAYINYIQERERKRVYQNQLEHNLKEIGAIKNIVRSHSTKIDKYKGIKNQINTEIKNYNSIPNLKSSLEKFVTDVSVLDTVLSELNNINDFPTSQTETETKNHISYCNITMQLQDVKSTIDKTVNIANKIRAERNRIENENRAYQEQQERERLERERIERERLAEEAERRKERNLKIAKYVGIALAIGVGIWILLAFIIPFIMEWWWAILLIAVAIGYFASKKD